jgi:AmmeMemoRadiSam system protein B
MPAGFKQCSEMGKSLADVIGGYGEKVLMVVSSDMNHYESDDVTRKKDELAIEKALELDAEGLLKVTSKKGITMCGVVPVAIALVAARHLNAEGARLVSYSTSGDASGDYGHVVGYAGIVIK